MSTIHLGLQSFAEVHLLTAPSLASAPKSRGGFAPLAPCGITSSNLIKLQFALSGASTKRFQRSLPSWINLVFHGSKVAEEVSVKRVRPLCDAMSLLEGTFPCEPSCQLQSKEIWSSIDFNNLTDAIRCVTAVWSLQNHCCSASMLSPPHSPTAVITLSIKWGQNLTAKPEVIPSRNVHVPGQKKHQVQVGMTHYCSLNARKPRRTFPQFKEIKSLWYYYGLLEFLRQRDAWKD